MNVHLPARLTIDTFFSWAAGQEQRCELVKGVPRLLPYVRLNHTIISNNIVHQILGLINREQFLVANGDFAIKTGKDTLRFADVMVMPSGKDGNILSADDAIVLFEVLSKSTMHEDFGAKRLEYQSLDSLQSYIVLAQDEPVIWLWNRCEDGTWPDQPEQFSEGKLAIEGIDITLEIDKLYRDVN